MQIVDPLRHTSDLTFDFLDRTAADAAYRAVKIDANGSNMTMETMIETLGKLTLEFSPGESFNYSISTVSGGGRPRLHHGRLPEVLPHAARMGRSRRQQADFDEEARVDDEQPSSRRKKPRGFSTRALQ
jgi:hypothetical protein